VLAVAGVPQLAAVVVAVAGVRAVVADLKLDGDGRRARWKRGAQLRRTPDAPGGCIKSTAGLGAALSQHRRPSSPRWRWSWW
jgi:hypothetical protein